ncbi:hypothetical protein [Sediminibacterium soli]|uniref:hypothetical protein n=1 Tax=Sediminibacterium soli TaxID=2698829 RepID=UPI00137A5F59|nr:hypothetical protein [Sediminibacterium soli]NCI47253.1 hypothetical protein [Sediminibacterium soli]
MMITFARASVIEYERLAELEDDFPIEFQAIMRTKKRLIDEMIQADCITKKVGKKE